ncbi:MAG: hypothetical protein KBG84_14200 [Planctomycetes bacterium]|nr:hypothetical protein [Planctomycetota bacterium]
MRAMSKVAFGLLLGLLGGSRLCAQDESLKDALAQLESPFAEDRANGKAELISHKGDISRELRKAMSETPECVQAELLDVVQRRRDGALVAQAAALLGARGDRLPLAARDYLLALKSEDLKLDGETLGAGKGAWESFLVFRRRYAITLALIEAQLKPGKYLGQFDTLRAEYGDLVDNDLLTLAQAKPDYQEALSKAAADRVARGLEGGDVIRNARFRRLFNGELLVLALKVVGEGSVDADTQKALSSQDSSGFAAAVYLLQDLRVAAVRALAQSANGEDISDRLAAFYATACKDASHELLKRLIDQDSLREEVEVVMARFGRTELLEARMAALRSRYEQPATGQVVANSRSAADVETQARNSIAYLYLRAGDAASAEREWQAAIDQVQIRMNASTGRARSVLAATHSAIYYNLACAQSLQHKTTKALGSLRKAVENGYAEFGWMLEDGDLESVRSTRAFTDWFTRVAPPSLSDALADGR